MKAVCSECHTGVEQVLSYSCPLCGGVLLLDYEKPQGSWMDPTENGIWKFHQLLPEVQKENRLYAGEGMTPLIKSVALAKRLGLKELYFKYEGGNPTGSYKDRIAAMGISWALASGRQACIGTSSGNAGAAVAAYAARAGIPYHLYALEHMAEAKLEQMLAYNAQVRKVVGFGVSPEVGERVFSHIFAAAQRKDWEVMITAYRYNPFAMEGVKTIAFELADQMAAMPSHVYAPAGGAGLYLGIWKGFNELFRFGYTSGKPQMVAVQSSGCSNIARAYANGQSVPAPGESTSLISGLQVPNPPDGKAALSVMAAGDGSAMSVEDEGIWEAQRMLAAEEGIFCEPAGAASVAGLIQACARAEQPHGNPVVCIISGVGFKDGARLSAMVSNKVVPTLQAESLDI
jgi:threonine synthase